MKIQISVTSSSLRNVPAKISSTLPFFQISSFYPKASFYDLCLQCWLLNNLFVICFVVNNSSDWIRDFFGGSCPRDLMHLRLPRHIDCSKPRLYAYAFLYIYVQGMFRLCMCVVFVFSVCVSLLLNYAVQVRTKFDC
jgi:hypothetical protein